VSLDGPIEASFLPSPRILANNVRLGAAGKDGGDPSADLMRIRAIEVRVALLPLLTGRVVVQRLTLVRPEVLVETDETGRTRWLMDGTSGGLPPDVALRHFAISDGTLVWRDRRHGFQTRVEDISLRMTADSLSGSKAVDGGATIGDVPVRFTMRVGRVKNSAPVPLNVSFESPGLNSKGTFNGRYLPGDARLTGRLKASGADARAVLAGMFGSAAAGGLAPALVAHPFGLEARVSAGAQDIEASDVGLDLADQHATGTVRVRLPQHPGKGTTVDAAFSTPRLDLDALATAPPLVADNSGKSEDWSDGARFNLALKAGALLVDGRAMQGFAAKVAFAKGKLAIEHVEGQLPGAGSFVLSGAISDTAGHNLAGVTPGRAPRFVGTIQADAANLRDLLSWFRVDARKMPPGRLARAQLTARILADARHAKLSDVDLHVDATRAHGTIGIDYQDHPKINVDLSADHLDLDAYLGDGGGAAIPTAASGVPTPVAFPPTPTPDILAAVVGDARFAIAHLTYRGMDLRDVNMVAKIDNGTFAIDRFSGSPPEPEQVLAPDVPLAGAEPASAAPIPAAAPASAAASVPAAAVAAPAPTKPMPAAAPSNTPSAAEPAPTPVPVQQVEDRADFVQGILKNLGH
ncbi:MAG TPA: hypothetical protein VFO61_04190, partial [Alphaproteobacteria bacterium]|nr:hypothetical protein [Alphaproteobacteria bacterium]